MAATLGLSAKTEHTASVASPTSELEKATDYWGKEYARNPRNTDAAVNYAMNLKAMGNKRQAIAVLEQASVFNSDHRGLASEYGRLALEAGNVSLAEKLLERADDPAKPDWRVISARGTVLSKKGSHRDAIPMFERALALSPNNASIMNNLAMAYAMNGEAPRAEEILKKASAVPGASTRVRQNLALVIGLQGRFDDAKSVAAADLPPEQAAQSIAYLQQMVDAAPPQVKSGPPAPWSTKVVKAPSSGKPAAVAGLKGTEATPAAPGSWATEVAAADEPVRIVPPGR
jgi:Flp pilus assembly protein TadD